MDKTIVWKAQSKTGFLTQKKPYAASSAIPEWWRKETPYEITPENPDGKRFLLRSRNANATFKKCTPMLDAIVSGYLIDLWADIQVTQTVEPPNIPMITWRTHQNVFELHGLAATRVPAPPGYDQHVFKYLNTWIPQTPPGYSVMVTAPFGHRDLPFHAIPAIIDSDKSTLETIFPMWIKTGFEGIVEQGTPLVQITPFKRDNWQSEFDYYEDGEYYGVVEERNFNTTIVNHYVKKHWSKKTYK
jgi:hypothetical protein